MSTLTLSDAKAHLNITVTTYDTELQTFIDAAEAAIEQRCGPLGAVQVSERVRGGTDALILTTTPVVSLTSVTPVNGSALDITGMHLDTLAGIVTYDSGSGFSSRAYDVVYAAGRSTVPNDLLQGVKELVRHLWKTQRGRAPGRVGHTTVSSEENAALVMSPDAFGALPQRVTQLIRPHMQMAI